MEVKILEKNDVNEEYIFDIMDKWAEERRVKTKGKWKKQNLKTNFLKQSKRTI